MPEPITLEQLTEKVAGLETDYAVTLKRAERAETVLKFTTEERVVYDKLTAEEKVTFTDDVPARVALLAKYAPAGGGDEDDEDEARAALLKRVEAAEAQAKANNETQKALETRVAAAEAVAKAEIAKREKMEFQKRAETELPNLPGTVEKKGGVLASIAKLSADEQKDVLELLSAGDAALKQLGKPVGSDRSGDAKASAWNRIEKKALAKRTAEQAAGNKMTQEQAVAAVMQEEPALYKEYLEESKPAA